VAPTASIIPFHDADRRTIWLRVVLLNACFFGLAASAPLWTNAHSFPLLPIISWFPVLHPPWDRALFGVLMISLILAAWIYRAAVGCFLAASFLAYCQDENRGQPWLYMYWVMLLLTLFPPKIAIAACRFAMSAVYIWSGVQKCNRAFFQVQPVWFVEPATHWHLPGAVLEAMRWAVACAPFIEIGIGIALWSARLRLAAIVAAVVIHAYALAVLGPWARDYNWVIWPWNSAMPLLLFVLFARGAYWEKVPIAAAATLKPAPAAPGAKSRPSKKAGKALPAPKPVQGTLATSWRELCRSKPALIIVALYSLLPILSYSGRWDSYFSFCLYSENLAQADIFITPAFAERLPAHMKSDVREFQPNFDPAHQGPFRFVFGGWCYKELHVPPISEPRNFVSIYRHLQQYSKDPSDLRMIIGPRSGPAVFYEGDSREFLMR